LRRFSILALIIIACAPLSAWGAKGHAIANGLMLKTLPKETRAWFKDREDYLRQHSTDPDDWKIRDRKEGPRHFLDCEVYGGPLEVPFELEAARAKLKENKKVDWYSYGVLPWIIQDRFKDLVEAFKSGDPDKVAEAAAILGHYVADAQVPLHSTENHDGQFTGQRGIHARWESSLVDRYVQEESLNPGAAKVDSQVLKAPWTWIAESNQLLPQLFADDKLADRSSPTDAQGGARRTSAYFSIFWSKQGDNVKQQLEKSAQRLGDLVLTAWTLAGKPEFRGK
jgi:S1/P1 Nuclease